VAWFTEKAAESEPGACELLAEAYVEGHIGVVGVHVKESICIRTVVHHERVMGTQHVAGFGKELSCQRLQDPLLQIICLQ